MRAPRILSMKAYNDEDMRRFYDGNYGTNIAFAGFRSPKTGALKTKGFVVEWETGHNQHGAQVFKTKTEARNWLAKERMAGRVE